MIDIRTDIILCIISASVFIICIKEGSVGGVISINRYDYPVAYWFVMSLVALAFIFSAVVIIIRITGFR